MKICGRIVIILLLSLFFNNAFALTIVSPKEGQIVYQGDKLSVIVKPDPGESWEEVEIDLAPMSYSFIAKKYTADIQIRKDKLGVISFYVRAYDKAGSETALKRSLFVKLPANVILQSIVINKDYILLYKLPAGSSPEDVHRIESRQLTVKGVYSDGAKRNVTAFASGTTYTSSNEKIVTVNQDGKVTSQGIGEAKVTIRNGKFSADVDIDVKPYRQPER